MRDRPLRLLYVTARYPPHVGGTEVHTAEVATRLGMSTGSVYQAKYRTSSLLVQEYSGQCGQGPQPAPGGPG